jgi:sulfate permease, SulP family
VILDLRRVQSVDITAAHMLIQVRDMLTERGVPLLLSNVREQLPSGRNLREFLEQVGLTRDGELVQIFPTIEAAIEWVEDRLVQDLQQAVNEEVPLRLQEMELFHGRNDDTLVDLEACMEQRSVKAGELVYNIGDHERELYLIRRGEIRIMAPISGSRQLHHIATFGRGNFFGGIAFLDGRPRGDNAIAQTDAELYVLSFEQFNKLAETHKRMAFILITDISRTLAHRLRHADGERKLLND